MSTRSEAVIKIETAYTACCAVVQDPFLTSQLKDNGFLKHITKLNLDLASQLGCLSENVEKADEPTINNA